MAVHDPFSTFEFITAWRPRTKVRDTLLAVGWTQIRVYSAHTCANTALRISGLMDLRYTQLDIKARQFERVEGKADKKRTVGLNNAAIGVIENRCKEWPVNVILFQTYSNRKPIRYPDR